MSGWIDTIRDHGNLLFIDLSETIMELLNVFDAKNPIFEKISYLNHETVIKITGKVLKRSKETINKLLLKLEKLKLILILLKSTF